jgi:hypothetical protein
MGQIITNLPQATPFPGTHAPGQPSVIAYEDLMSRDLRWAMSESSEFFEGKGRVQESLRRIAARLNNLGIRYAVAGGMALVFQGFRRYTEDVDILVTRSALKQIHEALEGLGYVPPFAGSKHLRDAETGVKIEFLITGDYPGDGKPKPVSFPDPAEVADIGDGVAYLNLPTLIQLKLASGMSNEQRGKDLVDVQELIKVLNLPLDFAEKLDPYVRIEFRKLWRKAQPLPATRFMILLPAEPKNFDELIASQSAEIDKLKAMQADGVTLETHGRRVFLVTADPEVARKYDMHDESEFLDETI